MSFIGNHDTPTVIHALSIRTAKQCRALVQGGFREEEWADIDREFYQLIRRSLEEYHVGTRKKLVDQHEHSN